MGPLDDAPHHDAPSEAARAWQARAHAAIPGGAHTYAKGDDQYPTNAPPVLVRGAGARVWDTDGRSYVEYGGGMRANVLGHGHPRVVSAVCDAVAGGTNFVRPSTAEIEAAEDLLEFVGRPTWMVKFTKNGSDANDAAIRLARAVTGRERVLRCEAQPFFSVSDWFIGTTPMSAGIPRAVSDPIGTFPYGDLAALRRALADRDVAAIVLEAAKYDDPPDGFLDGVRQACTDTGTVFVLDEMITGFRWPHRTAMQTYGIEPDLATYGKALGNGVAVSALIGRSDLMERGGLRTTDQRVFLLSYTHGAEHVGLAAARAVMAEWRETDVGDAIASYGSRLAERLRTASADEGVADQLQVIGLPQALVFATTDASGSPSQTFRTLLMQELVRGGVLGTSLVASAAHDDDVLEITVRAWQGAASVYAKALEDGPEAHLEGQPTKPVFRRYV